MNIYVLVGPEKHRLAFHCVQSLRAYYPEHRPIVVASEKTYKAVVRNLPPGSVGFRDEEQTWGGLSFGAVQAKLGAQGRGVVGWYFQQFSKLQWAFCDDSSDPYYLVVDSDTIFLNRVELFENGLPIFSMKEEFHRPYFELMERILPFGKLVSESFISEFMIFRKDLVRNLLSDLGGRDHWYHLVVDHVLTQSDLAFSEFETYGNFVERYSKDAYRKKRLRIQRFEGEVLGRSLRGYEKRLLAKQWDVVTFERHRYLRRHHVWANRLKVLIKAIFDRPLNGPEIYEGERFGE